MERQDQNAHLKFNNAPPGIDSEPKWSVHRVKKGKALKVLCLSHALIGHDLHYTGGRSRPHFELDCEHCAAGHRDVRWYGYLATCNLDLSAPTLLEVTKMGAVCVDRYVRSYGSLRGCELIVSRKADKKNGEQHVVIKQGKMSPDVIPAAPNVVRMLMRMWGVPDTIAFEARAVDAAGFVPKSWRAAQ